MKHVREFIVSSLVGGLLIMLPIYLSVLLLLKAMKAVTRIVEPIASCFRSGFPAKRFCRFFLC